MSPAFGIQDGIVAVLAVLALAWLVRRRVRRRARPTPLCEECPGCAPARGSARVPAPVLRDDLIPIARITGRRDA